MKMASPFNQLESYIIYYSDYGIVYYGEIELTKGYDDSYNWITDSLDEYEKLLPRY